jgi:hypothetical protein
VKANRNVLRVSCPQFMLLVCCPDSALGGSSSLFGERKAAVNRTQFRRFARFNNVLPGILPADQTFPRASE